MIALHIQTEVGLKTGIFGRRIADIMEFIVLKFLSLPPPPLINLKLESVCSPLIRPGQEVPLNQIGPYSLPNKFDN